MLNGRGLICKGLLLCNSGYLCSNKKRQQARGLLTPVSLAARLWPEAAEFVTPGNRVCNT